MRLQKEDQGTPFGEWWSLYGDHCPRMGDRKKCKDMFNKLNLETQRAVYKDTKDRLKSYDDWQEKTPEGRRKFMSAPIVYLRAKRWECPVDATPVRSTVRDTTKPTVNVRQEIQGLKQLKSQMERHGHDTASIDGQILSLQSRLGPPKDNVVRGWWQK